MDTSLRWLEEYRERYSDQPREVYIKFLEDSLLERLRVNVGLSKDNADLQRKLAGK